jgi:hypothetical protein
LAGLSWALPLPSQQAARRRAARDARAPSRFLHAAPQFGIDNAKRSRYTNSDWEEKEAAEKQWHEDQTCIAVADSFVILSFSILSTSAAEKRWQFWCGRLDPGGAHFSAAVCKSKTPPAAHAKFLSQSKATDEKKHSVQGH